MGHAADADEFLEVLGEELGSVVGDDSGSDTGVTLLPLLNNLFDVGLGHSFADVPVDDGAAGAVEDGAKVVEGAGDVEVGDVDVPVFVGPEGLHESGPFQAGLGFPAFEQAGLGENAVDGGGRAGDDVAVDHHETEAAVAFERELVVEVDDGFSFVGGEPVVAGDVAVVFVGLAVTLFSSVSTFHLS